MLNVIVAPRSYNSKAEKHVKKIVKYLKYRKEEFSVYFLHSLEDIASTVKEIISVGETDFVLIGDDSFVFEFLNSTKEISKLKLGIVPTSKHDDFASYINLPHNPIQAIKDILERNITETDILLVNDLKVLNNIVLGASVEVWEKYSQFKIKNKLSEKIATTKYAGKYNGEVVQLATKNNKPKTETIYEMVIANGGKSKGKLLSPLSNVSDGLFNVSYSLLADKSNNLRHLKMFNRGNHIYENNTKQLWLNNLKITSTSNSIKAIVDGKILTLEDLDIQIIEKALKIYKSNNN